MSITYFIRQIYRKRGIITRAILIWIIGLLVLSNDETKSYDTRFKIRGERSPSDQITVINIKISEMTKIYRYQVGFNLVNDYSDVTDHFFWDLETWTELLQKILEKKPKKVIVTLFFGEHLNPPQLSQAQKNILTDPRVIWSSAPSGMSQPLFPLFSNYSRKNVGSNEFNKDEDEVIRKFTLSERNIPHLAEKAIDRLLPLNFNQFINYRGGAKSFVTESLDTILNETSTHSMKDQIVVIGPQISNTMTYATPLGSASRAQVTAHIIDNYLHDSWVKRASFFYYASELFFLLIISVFIMIQFPQKVALVFLIGLGTLTTALSIWIFDQFSFWLPIQSPLIQLTTTWVLYIGYQANKLERKHWQLKQEQRYLQQLEQLKNNFVSLISHDLKTPIARIQAVVSRLQRQTPSVAKEDLVSLQDSSDELNRYIQSILKVLRVESRDFKLHREVADVNEVIQSAVMQLQTLAHDKNIKIQLHLEPLFSLEFDTTLIKEVVINLIENAIKFTPPGGEIHVLTQEQDRWVEVTVNDNGEGIPESELTSIWGKFVRGKDQDMKTKGSGLGLYLVKYFVELHGGQVRLTSQLGKGTRVSFTLPLEESPLPS